MIISCEMTKLQKHKDGERGVETWPQDHRTTGPHDHMTTGPRGLQDLQSLQGFQGRLLASVRSSFVQRVGSKPTDVISSERLKPSFYWILEKDSHWHDGRQKGLEPQGHIGKVQANCLDADLSQDLPASLLAGRVEASAPSSRLECESWRLEVRSLSSSGAPRRHRKELVS